MLGIQTRGGRMEGADESTEQWRHPSSANCLYLVLIATGLPTVQHSPRVVDRVNKFDSVHVYFQAKELQVSLYSGHLSS